MVGMSKSKKPTGGKHKTERRNLPLPEPWMVLAEELAAESQQPTGWFVIKLLKAAAETAGKPAPVPPWDKKKPADPSK